MTKEEIKERCQLKGITFLPHHPCGCCGEYTGWYLFGRWPPYEVAYSSACGCGYSDARPDDWDSILEWVCDKDGNLRGEYQQMLGIEPKEFKGKMVMIPQYKFTKAHVAYCMHVDEYYHCIDWMGNGDRLRVDNITLRLATVQEIADAATNDCKLISKEYDFG